VLDTGSFSSPQRQKCSGAHPSVGAGAHFLLVQRLGSEFVTHIRLLMRLKGMRLYVNPLYVFMRWCLIRHIYVRVEDRERWLSLVNAVTKLRVP
jgi:hypothetical protein